MSDHTVGVAELRQSLSRYLRRVESRREVWRGRAAGAFPSRSSSVEIRRR